LIRILFFGDLMPPPFGRAPFFAPEVRRIAASADLAIGNLETAVGKDSAWLNRFQIRPETLASVVDRFGLRRDRCLLSIANNHIVDLGSDGVRRTATALRGLGIQVLGQRVTGGSPLGIVAAGGLSVGVLSWTQWLNHGKLAEDAAVWEQRDALAWFRKQERPLADFLVAFPHWGFEFEHFPRSRERNLAVRLAEGGVQLIVGHHPHVIQPLERIGDSYCLYSLGGLVPGRVVGFRWPVRLSALLTVDVAKQRNGLGKVVGYEIHPIVARCSRRDGRVCLLDAALPRDRRKMRRRFDHVYLADVRT
jgi:poly-gamma-glutamate capsule biosynthesis protein CapA/YwtB (metallophosphatase superfamily)